MKRLLGVLAVIGLTLAGTALPASAVDPGKGSPGYCPDANGVTVVIDFQELGGTTIVRCAPGDQATGLAALKNAGIQVAGTARWGEALLCRIEGKPGPDVEPCVDAPPNAYWAYWYATNGGAWKSSELGVTNHKPPPGSFEGWSFSKNRTEASNPPPRIAPVRPGAQQPQQPQQPAANPPVPPAGHNGAPPPPAQATQPPATAPAPTSAPATSETSAPPSSAPSASSVAGSSSATAGTAANGVEWTGDPGLASQQQQSSGVPWTVIAGGVVVLALAAGAGVTMRRRRRSGS
jgi:hypothetical protein